MPFALIIVAIVFVVVGLRGTHQELFCLLKQDFSGQGNFLYWFAAVILIGAIGYVKKLQPISDGFLLLLIVALFLTTKGGLFQQVSSAIQSTNNQPATTQTNVTTGAQNLLSSAQSSLLGQSQ